METWPSVFAIAVFLGVILVITFDWLQMTVAAFLGALLLVFAHIMTLPEAVGYIGKSHGTLALFFGVMVLIRAFEPTHVFDYLATQMVILAKGKGRNLLLGIVALTTPICAILPNATTVMLLAPLLPPIAAEVGVDCVPLLILLVVVANSAGLLTLVGDPATFIVGDAINFSFQQYLERLSWGGVVAIAAVLITLPWLFRSIWKTQLKDLDDLPRPKIQHPVVLAAELGIVFFVLLFFVIGESLPTPISPAAVALMGAALALLLSHHSKTDSLHNILQDVDWGTLIFFMCIFVLIGGLEKTGAIAGLSQGLAVLLGQDIAKGSLVIVFCVGIFSSVVPNIPLVVAMVPLLKQYLVQVGLAPAEIMSPTFEGQLPVDVLPLFYSMMFGATLGGNATLIGASANIVAGGIAEQHGHQITFRRFLKYGLPITALQLVMSAFFIYLTFLK
jgi:Na+/H+ antiporter NhaD/arsenite permease-like protein